ncbi:hypothetical protein GA0061094_0053 [[Bacillus] enclensis]|uniref:Uncharacterized protein n=1 Tax=[Bacillus] enclensis TaxID=1402860 RepID=A0A1C3YQA7_9BACI|nr:hypothetical protein [[Bacillus] enclensis]SCB72295.1 hypothetical protein GA0061094_0053 [[Bacillus] enclensis]
MENKPYHYDGSSHTASGAPTENEPFKLTEEMRKNLGANPFGAAAEEE